MENPYKHKNMKFVLPMNFRDRKAKVSLAASFARGIAIVAKGKWTIDPKRDNRHCRGCYRTDEDFV